MGLFWARWCSLGALLGNRPSVCPYVTAFAPRSGASKTTRTGTTTAATRQKQVSDHGVRRSSRRRRRRFPHHHVMLMFVCHAYGGCNAYCGYDAPGRRQAETEMNREAGQESSSDDENELLVLRNLRDGCTKLRLLALQVGEKAPRRDISGQVRAFLPPSRECSTRPPTRTSRVAGFRRQPDYTDYTGIDGSAIGP